MPHSVYQSEDQLLPKVNRVAMDDLRDNLESWYTRNEANPLALDDLSKMLASDPETRSVVDVLPVDDYEERLALARKFDRFMRKLDPSFETTSSLLAAFFVLPIRQLRDGMQDQVKAAILGRKLQKVEEAAHRCKLTTISSCRFLLYCDHRLTWNSFEVVCCGRVCRPWQVNDDSIEDKWSNPANNEKGS